MKNLLFILLIYPFVASSQVNDVPLYKNSSFTSEERAKDLLNRMNVEEKVAQLMSSWLTNFSYDQNGNLSQEKLDQIFKQGINSVQPAFAPIAQTVEERNTIQKYLLEKTRLGIPAIFVDEGLHGLMRPESTVFPQAIGIACSWNPELVEQIYDIIAREMRSRGTGLVLSPVIDMNRDPRWGRTDETFGEDPYICSQMGIAAVRGFQGSSNGVIDENHVAATLKHFSGHGQAEGGINKAPANVSTRILFESHFAPFRNTIAEASPIAVMPSYNEIDGVPSHGNKWLLKDVLRDQFGFDGIIVSDYAGISQLINPHAIAENNLQAAELAFNAGVQIELPSGMCFKELPKLINNGAISAAEIDSAVYQVLKLKFDLGLFENPFVNEKKAVAISKLKSSKEIALKAAQQSIVLLKNDGVLPLDKKSIKKIAVIGPGADSHSFGGYPGAPYYATSLLEGIQAKVGKGVEVVTAQGVKITENWKDDARHNWMVNDIILPTREDNLKLINEAKEIAKTADVIILAIGENEQICREVFGPQHLGDNVTLDLISNQQELADSLLTLGKPVIVYLQNGRPLSITKLDESANAVIEGWYMGQESGTAAADVIFGDVNPSAKLTITFPKSVGQLPLYYNHKPSAQFTNYISMDKEPLYPFGYGLSYTTFSYSEPKLSKATIKKEDSSIVTVTVTNTGKVEGDEIVQLYIRDEVSSVTRPVKELKGFKRISLDPGESKDVSFEINKSMLAFWNIDMNYVVEPGTFKIMVGNSSDNLNSLSLTVNE